MKTTVLILNTAVLLASLCLYVFLQMAETYTHQTLRGQALPSLTCLVYQFKSAFVVLALMGIAGTLIKMGRGNLKDTDVLFYGACALLFVTAITGVSVVAVFLPSYWFISPLR